MNPPRKPELRPIVAPVEFRPFQGLLSIAERFTRAVERRVSTRLGDPLELWDGEDGVSGVVADILRDLGLSEKPVPIGTSERAISPRVVAEKCGLVKRRNPKRRARA